MRTHRRAGAATVALLLGGAGVALTTGTAQAAEVSYKTECLPPPISGLPPVKGTTKVDITAPATAKVGDEVEVVWKTVEAASKNPNILDLGKDTVKPTGKLTLGGAQSGEVPMEGPRQNPPIPKNSPMVLSDMKAKVKLTKAGDVTLTPGAYSINVNKPISTDTKCSAKETVKPGATIKVTDGGGSTSGGSTGSGGTSTSGGTGSSGGTAAGGTTTSGGSSSSGGSTAGGNSGGSTGGSSGSTGGSSGGSDGGDSFTGKEVSVDYQCKTPIGDKNATSPVQINAKKNGGGYDLTVKFGKSVMDSPADIPAGSVKPSMAVKVGGADKGTVKTEGAPNKDPIKTGQPIAIPDLKGAYKPGASGKATLTPGVLTVNALGTTTTCTPAKDPGASLQLDTTAQQGGVSGGSGSGGSSGGTGGHPASAGGTGAGASGGSAATSGGLAATGADDHGSLKALGLIAGCAVLLGAAVFTFTPWRRLRR
ncbi:hypothetical protein AB0I49_31815 [Streptomyces sp. NPDC050617]|uniref:hypothetical protein n=1 Tax=Streptomyces sp. NPDC050617 TaxID=3154628 RepID=UPI003432D791